MSSPDSNAPLLVTASYMYLVPAPSKKWEVELALKPKKQVTKATQRSECSNYHSTYIDNSQREVYYEEITLHEVIMAHIHVCIYVW